MSVAAESGWAGRRWLRPGMILWRWLSRGQGVVGLLLGFLTIDMLIWTAFDFSKGFGDALAESISSSESSESPGFFMKLEALYPFFESGMLRWLLLALPVFVLWGWRGRGIPVLPVAWYSVAITLLALPASLYYGLPRAQTSAIGEEPYVGGFLFGVFLMLLLLAMPTAALVLYRRGGVLDRYVTRTFLLPFAICFTGFVSIWLITEMANKATDYLALDVPPSEIMTLYLLQLPAVTVIILPITLMLAALYALGRMSKTNELVSMMMSGRSIYRILRPIFVVSAFATLLSLVCNFEWAPTAAGTADAAGKALSKKSTKRYAAYDQTFVNRVENRIWFVGMFPHDYQRRDRLRGVVVMQFNENNQLTMTVHANSAFWQVKDGAWVFFGSQVTFFDDRGEPVRVKTDPKHLEWEWPETPWLLISTGIRAEYLGLPQIGAYLRAYADSPPERLAPFRTHWHYRLSMPLACFAAVMVAAPLGIAYSRRGLVGGVSAAILIFFASIFLTNLLLALGQSGRIPAIIAAWLPNLLFAAVGCWLLHLRHLNRELPSPKKAIQHHWSNLRSMILSRSTAPA